MVTYKTIDCCRQPRLPSASSRGRPYLFLARRSCIALTRSRTACRGARHPARAASGRTRSWSRNRLSLPNKRPCRKAQAITGYSAECVSGSRVSEAGSGMSSGVYFSFCHPTTSSRPGSYLQLAGLGQELRKHKGCCNRGDLVLTRYEVMQPELRLAAFVSDKKKLFLLSPLAFGAVRLEHHQSKPKEHVYTA